LFLELYFIFLYFYLDASAQWAAYYAQYYQAQQAPAAAAAGGSGGGQADYTQQWIEYLRAQGQHQQADMLDQQMKQSQNGNGANGAGQERPSAAPGGGGNPGGGGPGAAPAGAAGNGDYSAAWAEHYRSIGKIEEAEQIEKYIKSTKVKKIITKNGKKIQSKMFSFRRKEMDNQEDLEVHPQDPRTPRINNIISNTTNNTMEELAEIRADPLPQAQAHQELMMASRLTETDVFYCGK
jgi:hypothetical protein